MKKISIIIPAYNEEESMPLLYERLKKLMNSIKKFFICWIMDYGNLFNYYNNIFGVKF